MLILTEIFENPPPRAPEAPTAVPADGAGPTGSVPAEESAEFDVHGQTWVWLESMPPEFAWPDDPEQVKADEFWWGQLTRRDLEHLTGPRRYPDPCVS